MQTGLSLSIRQVLAAALVTDFTESTTGSTLQLFQNNFTPSPLSLVADFTACNFVGYASKTALTTWRTYNDAPTGDQIIDQTVEELFAATSILTPQTAYGWYLTDNAGTELLAWGVFDVPYTFSTNGDKLAVSPFVRLPLSTGQTET